MGIEDVLTHFSVRLVAVLSERGDPTLLLYCRALTRRLRDEPLTSPNEDVEWYLRWADRLKGEGHQYCSSYVGVIGLRFSSKKPWPSSMGLNSTKFDLRSGFSVTVIA